MLIQTFVGGVYETNGYLVCDRRGGSALVVDAPEGTAAALARQAKDWGASIRYLVTTHGHWDHFVDNAMLLRLTGAKFGIHRDSAPLLKIPQARYAGFDLDIEPSKPDFFLEEGKTLEVGDLDFEILDVSGHCPGSVALFERRARVVFVGDALFAGSIGRTDLPGGDTDLLLRSIREKLLTLGDDVRVFSGHGPATTIGQERRSNPFLSR
jgi:glyoxylase-like metal-dependent hydrolase (beta-lactamase superfamily II)